MQFVINVGSIAHQLVVSTQNKAQTNWLTLLTIFKTFGSVWKHLDFKLLAFLTKMLLEVFLESWDYYVYAEIMLNQS